MHNYLAFILIVLFGGIQLSCSSSQPAASRPSPPSPSKYYTTAFPSKDVSAQLQSAHGAILRIVSTGFYDTFLFDNKYVTLADVHTNGPKRLSTYSFSTEESTAGTSIILETNSENSLLVTCAHVISFPDTLVSYYEGENIPENRYVESISIKKRQTNLLFTGRQLLSFDIIAADETLDIALLDAALGTDADLDYHPLGMLLGNSENLQLGSFLYILGFPKGYTSITRGIASSPEDWNDRFFVTDALFNPGISGGLVIASNDNFNTFQWVGMASSASASNESLIVPVPTERYSRAVRPYRDSLYVQQKSRINYGITQAIPINKIREFLRDNRRAIGRRNFRLSANNF